MNPADVASLDLRRDLALVRDAITAQLRAGASPVPLLEAVGERDPLALVDLVMGPQAPRGADAVRAALAVAPLLESTVAPLGLYRRLLDLGPDAGPDVLAIAAARHPAASWIVALSARAEGDDAGRIHLRAAADHPAFAAAAWARAAAGHRRGLVAAAGDLGRPEPAAALAAAGAAAEAAEAAVRTHEADPACPVVAWIAAAWGPDLDPLRCHARSHLRTASAASALVGPTATFPVASARLAALRRALR